MSSKMMINIKLIFFIVKVLTAHSVMKNKKPFSFKIDYSRDQKIAFTYFDLQFGKKIEKVNID